MANTCSPLIVLDIWYWLANRRHMCVRSGLWLLGRGISVYVGCCLANGHHMWIRSGLWLMDFCLCVGCCLANGHHMCVRSGLWLRDFCLYVGCCLANGHHMWVRSGLWLCGSWISLCMLGVAWLMGTTCGSDQACGCWVEGFLSVCWALPG